MLACVARWLFGLPFVESSDEGPLRTRGLREQKDPTVPQCSVNVLQELRRSPRIEPMKRIHCRNDIVVSWERVGPAIIFQRA